MGGGGWGQADVKSSKYRRWIGPRWRLLSCVGQQLSWSSLSSQPDLSVVWEKIWLGQNSVHNKSQLVCRSCHLHYLFTDIANVRRPQAPCTRDLWKSKPPPVLVLMQTSLSAPVNVLSSESELLPSCCACTKRFWVYVRSGLQKWTQ